MAKNISEQNTHHDQDPSSINSSDLTPIAQGIGPLLESEQSGHQQMETLLSDVTSALDESHKLDVVIGQVIGRLLGLAA